MINPQFIYRKELATLLDCSVRTVKRNEDRWGIRQTRRDLGRREVRYARTACLKILQLRRMLS